MFLRNTATFKIILFIVLAISFIFAIAQIKEIALLFFASYVIACSMNPIVDKMSLKMPRAAATAIVMIVSTLIIILVVFPLTVMALKELKTLFSHIPAMIVSILDWLKSLTVMGYKVSSYISFEPSVESNSNAIVGNIINKSYAVTMGILDAFTVIFSMLMIVFYLVFEKKEIHESTLKLFPPKIRKKAGDIIYTIESKVGGYVLAQALSMSTVGFVTFMGLMLINVDFALLLGIIAGILDIIPIVGPTLALLLGIFSASTKGLIWIFPTILVYLSGQWISNHLVRPIVFGKFMQLHPLIVLFSFFVAAQFLGVWGVILAPAIAALLLTLFDELYVKTINEKSRRNDG